MRSLLPLLLVCAWFSPAAWAQSNFGEIRGQVLDASGGGVPGAKVKIRDLGTNQSIEITTSETGFYVAAALRPVSYEITVEANGFQSAVVSNIKVDTAKTVTADITLKPGQLSTKVDVTDEVPLVQTYSGALTQTVDQKTIVETPLNGRNTIQLALTLPGVAGSPGSELSELTTNEPLPGRELSVNGGRIGSTQFLADGANVTSVALSRMSISFSPDTIQEFSVQQANYSAQYAQAGGAIVQQTTKSGSNQFRGTAYWFHRQKAFTANPFGADRIPAFNFDARPPLRRQQIGGVFSGPVIIPGFGWDGYKEGKRLYDGRNKTFWLFSYEPTRQLASDPGGAQFRRVPTERELNGDFSQSLVYFRQADGTLRTEPYALLYRQFDRRADGTLAYIPNPAFNPALPAGVTNPRYRFNGFELFNPNDPDPARRGRVMVDASGRSYVNPVAQAIARALYPRSNLAFGSVVTNPGANFAFFRRTQFKDDRYTTRLDHILGPKHNLSFRYTDQPLYGDRAFRDPVQNGLISDANTSRQILGTWTSTVTPRLVNELRLNYVYGNFGRNFPSELLNRDLTNEFLNIGGPGQGSPNILGYGSARFMPAYTPTGVSGQQSGAQFDALGFNSPQDVGRNIEHSYNLTNDLSWVRGNYTLKIGFSGSHLQLNQANLGVGSLAGGRYDFARGQTNQSNCSVNPLAGALAGCQNDPAGGDQFASYLLGVPSGLQVQTENLSNVYYYRWTNLGAYVQNDWRVTPSLTLNLGVRYQYQSPRWEKNNFQGLLNLNRLEANPFRENLPAPVFEFAGIDGRSRYLVAPQKAIFEPRFGFAWTPGFSWNRDKRLVIRGGYGLTHATLMGNDREPIPNIGSQTFGGFRSVSYLLGSNDFVPPTNTPSCGLARCNDPGVPMQFGYNNPVLANDPTMFIIPRNGLIRPGDLAAARSSTGTVPQDVRYQATGVVRDETATVPRVQNYSLMVEFQFMPNTVWRTSYQGSRGTQLFGPSVNLNREDPFTGRFAIPGYAGRNNAAIYLLDPTNAASTYHAFVTEVQRNFSQGLQFRFNYTFSKAMDNSSGGIKFPIPNNSFNNATGDIPFQRIQNPYNLQQERSVSSTNQPHIFNIVSFYELPFGRGKKLLNRGGFVDQVFGNWQMSWLGRIRSGFPITVPLGVGNSLDLGSPGASLRPDLIAGVPLVNPDWTPQNAQFTSYINPRAFAFPEPGRFGNAPRNFSVGFPWVRTFDASLLKSFPLNREKGRRIELRAEFFNVFNLRNYEGGTNPGGLFSAGAQNPLLVGAQPNRTPVAGVQNRFRNLTSPGVWEALIQRNQGVSTDVAIAALPGPGAGGVGCPANAAEINSTTAALSPACTARVLQLNPGFGRLNLNTFQARVVQFALKLYF
jgi:hypothetical protein